jgi:outer membrane protein assembly factor BamB
MSNFKQFEKYVLLFLIMNFNDAFSQESWSKILPNIGTLSSPRVTDLNNDGVGDIILGAGRYEFMACDSSVVALNGKNGDLLWKVKAKDQMFGSATLKDVNNDGVKDIFIGGRSAQLMAIDGSTGKVIWKFKVPKNQKNQWFNFYNPQFIADQNEDGFEDIIVSNGGDVNAAPYDTDRPTGYLAIIDGENGDLISRAPMPDGKETYMSISVLPSESNTKKNIIYGTGGETVGGALFITSLEEVLKGDLSGSIKLDKSKSKGFVGTAVWVDINMDRIPDIVTNSADGRLLAFDGKSYEKIWSVQIPNTEAYGAVAVGNFNGDLIPDFFVSYAEGVWPDLEWSKQIMVNGSNGVIEFEDSLGYYQMSSPVVADVNNDGIDEAIIAMNYKETDKYFLTYYHVNLAIMDFTINEVRFLKVNYPGSNIASTPWIGDLNNNGFADIIFVHGSNNRKVYKFDGVQVNRILTGIPLSKKIKWGSYMGSNYDGVFEKLEGEN